MFFKKNNKKIHSDEFEELLKRIQLNSTDLEVIKARIELLEQSFRKLRASVTLYKRHNKIDDEQDDTENNKYSVFL